MLPRVVRQTESSLSQAVRGISSSVSAQWIKDLGAFESVKAAPEGYAKTSLPKFLEMVKNGPKRPEPVPADWKEWVRGNKGDKAAMFGEWSALYAGPVSNTDPISLEADPEGKLAPKGRRT